MDIPGKKDVKGDGAIIQYYSFTGDIKAAKQKHKQPLCSWLRHLKIARGWSLPELQRSTL